MILFSKPEEPRVKQVYKVTFHSTAKVHWPNDVWVIAYDIAEADRFARKNWPELTVMSIRHEGPAFEVQGE